MVSSPYIPVPIAHAFLLSRTTVISLFPNSVTVRRPRSDDGFRHQPFTVEALLQHLRLHATHAMQANPAQQLQRVKSFANAWIEATYVDPNARRHVKKALKEIVNEEKDVFWYTCRRCGLWI